MESENDTYIARLLKLNEDKPQWYKDRLKEMSKETELDVKFEKSDQPSWATNAFWNNYTEMMVRTICQHGFKFEKMNSVWVHIATEYRKQLDPKDLEQIEKFAAEEIKKHLSNLPIE